MAPARPRMQAPGLQCLRLQICGCFSQPPKPCISRCPVSPESSVIKVGAHATPLLKHPGLPARAICLSFARADSCVRAMSYLRFRTFQSRPWTNLRLAGGPWRYGRKYKISITFKHRSRNLQYEIRKYELRRSTDSSLRCYCSGNAQTQPNWAQARQTTEKG